MLLESAALISSPVGSTLVVTSVLLVSVLPATAGGWSSLLSVLTSILFMLLLALVPPLMEGISPLEAGAQSAKVTQAHGALNLGMSSLLTVRGDNVACTHTAPSKDCGACNLGLLLFARP